MGAFKKKHLAGKYCVLNDLSWSWPPGHSVNNGIPTGKFSLTYISVDDVRQIKFLIRCTRLAKLDLTSAYHQILVHPSDWELLGSSWVHEDGNNNLVKSYFILTVLPFRLCSSIKLFTDFAYSTKLIMQDQGVFYVDQYLD